MREIRTLGSARGAPGNGRSYRDTGLRRGVVVLTVAEAPSRRQRHGRRAAGPAAHRQDVGQSDQTAVWFKAQFHSCVTQCVCGRVR